MSPAALSLLTVVFEEGEERNRAMLRARDATDGRFERDLDIDFGFRYPFGKHVRVAQPPR